MARPTNNEILLRSFIDLIATEVASRLKPGAGSRRPGPAAAKPTTAAGKRKRNLSPEGRARISEAAKKRWAEHRKSNPQSA